MTNLCIILFSKPTFISISSVILILISVPLGIYNYINSDESTVGWVLTFQLFLFITVAIFYSIDRFLVKKIKPRLVSLFEVVLTILISIILTYNSRQLFIDLRDSKQSFVLVIENTGQLQNSEFKTKSLYNREIKTIDNLIIVDRIPKNITLKQRPYSWNQGHYYYRYSYNKYKNVVLFSNLNIDEKISESFIDSIVVSN